jgi:hypothetical protein
MKKRSKYRPKHVLANPVAYVIESLTLVSKHDEILINLKIKNSESMFSLLHGSATAMDMVILRDMSNMTEAFCAMNFGKEHLDIANKGRIAIFTIVDRAGKIKKFVPTGLEIQALNDLLELHNAQMDVVTVRDMEKAIQLVKHKIVFAKDTIKLTMPET